MTDSAFRPMSASDARSLLREAVRLNVEAQKYYRPTRFSEERDEVVRDLTGAGFPANFADYEHPSDV